MKRANMLLLVGVFLLLTFALFRFWSAKSKAVVAQVVSNMYVVQSSVEEFNLRAKAYPLTLDDKTTDYNPETVKEFSLEDKLSEKELANPYGGVAIRVLKAGEQPPQQEEKGLVLYIPTPRGSEQNGGGYRIVGYNGTGELLGLVLTPSEGVLMDTVEPDTDLVIIEGDTFVPLGSDTVVVEPGTTRTETPATGE